MSQPSAGGTVSRRGANGGRKDEQVAEQWPTFDDNWGFMVRRLSRSYDAQEAYLPELHHQVEQAGDALILTSGGLPS